MDAELLRQLPGRRARLVPGDERGQDFRLQAALDWPRTVEGGLQGCLAVGFDIEGETEFRAGDTSHISGLRVDGDQLSITLNAPAPDFLELLAEPTFCAVPVGTPINTVDGGAAIPTGDATAEVTVPSAGPYYIARHLNGEYTILMVNPNYAGARPHRLDAIVLGEGIAPSQASTLVETGEWDGITNMHCGPHDVGDEFGDRIGCRSLFRTDRAPISPRFASPIPPDVVSATTSPPSS